MDRAAIWPAALAALFGVIALAELLAPADVAPPLPAPRADTAAAPQPDAAGAAGWASVILARPIFRPDRRPLAAAPVAAAAMPRLTAIVITAAGASAIFVRDDGTAMAVKAGGEVDGLVVKAVTQGAVTLAGPAGVTVLRPQFAAAPPAPGAAPDATPNGPSPAFPTNLDRY